MRTMCSLGERLVGSAGTVGEEIDGPMRELERSVSGRGDRPGGGG